MHFTEVLLRSPMPSVGYWSWDNFWIPITISRSRHKLYGAPRVLATPSLDGGAILMESTRRTGSIRMTQS